MTDKNTFYNMLKSNAESQPDAVAVVYDTMKVTYEKLFDDVVFLNNGTIAFTTGSCISHFPVIPVVNIVLVIKHV